MPRKTLFLLGLSACLCLAWGLFDSTVNAQSVTPIAPTELNPEIGKTAGEWPSVEWEPGQGEHPGQKLYKDKCAGCHTLDDKALVGPGFAGLWERVEAVEYEGTVRERILNFVVKPGVDDRKDPYFKALKTTMMPARGGLTTDEEVMAVLDFIFNFTYGGFDESAWRRQVKLGADYATGAEAFKAGAPSCTSCHTVGPQKNMRGSNIGPNVAHTFNEAMVRGGDDKSMYIEGLKDVLAGKDAPEMHSYYRNLKGDCSLTDDELLSLQTFFERQLREVGTERTSNYLPVLALLLAAFSLLLFDGSFYSKLFNRGTPEPDDGPYEPDHHDDHEPSDNSASDSSDDDKEDSDSNSDDDDDDDDSDDDDDEVDEDDSKEDESTEDKKD